jgi:hypothetical protein
MTNLLGNRNTEQLVLKQGCYAANGRFPMDISEQVRKYINGVGKELEAIVCEPQLWVKNGSHTLLLTYYVDSYIHRNPSLD